MCGIIGYKGKKHPKEILLSGLKNLEYRGYDSAGIALKNDSDIQIIKSVGKISNLEEKVNNEKLIDTTMGIAHTRWATHGVPSEANAHPHKVGKITLVHNGIIENADEIREKLVKENVTFNSQTDTEVACALINYYYDGDLRKALEKALKELRGSYALCIMTDDNDNLYAVRKDSPLILGIGEDELFVASDIAAIINYTKKYILLEENEIVEIVDDKYTITKNGRKVKKEIQETDMSSEAKDKCGYDHYMLKEIMEEPVVLEKTFRPYIDDITKIKDLSEYEEIHIVACGSAMYAGIIGKTLLEEKANVKCYVECASEYRYKKVIYDRKTLVILISQSGETADTIAAMRKAKENGIETLGIINVKTSTIAREVDSCIFIEAGPEIAVATTKAYILQVAILSLLSYRAALSQKLIEEINIKEEMSKLPRLLVEVLDRRDVYHEIANKIYKHDNMFFIGRKVDYSICLEGSLKLNEISYRLLKRYMKEQILD